MSRRRRVSRALIGALGATLALGLVFWLHNLTKTKAATPQAADAKAPPAPPVGVHGSVAPAPAAAPAARAPAAIDTPKVEAPKPSGLVTQTPTALTKTTAITPTLTPTAQPTVGGATTKPAHSAAPSNAAVSASSATPLVDAQAKIDANDHLAARNTLNGALASGKLSAADAKAAKQLLNKVNDVVVFSPRKFGNDTVTGAYAVKSGDSLDRIARRHEITAKLLARINRVTDPKRIQAGKDLKVVTGPFHALVDKSDFTLEVWLGNPGESGAMYVSSFPVGLGMDDSTPTGTWIVETGKKLENPTYFSPRGEGVIAADDPDNPLGEYWIGLSGIDGQAVGKQSYGIHGTIRPDSIGKQESMGCVRLTNEDVAKVFELLVEGKSTVIVQD